MADAEEEDAAYDDDDEVEAHADADAEAEEELQPVESWALLGARKRPLTLELSTITTFSESVAASPANPNVKGNESSKKNNFWIFIFKLLKQQPK